MNDRPIDINYVKVASYVQSRRPRAELRDQLDLGFKYENNTFEIFEIRPVWNSSNPNDYQKMSFAKFRYIKSKKIWKLYWMRASGKWDPYEPLPQSTNVDTILKTIESDEYGCFYG